MQKIVSLLLVVVAIIHLIPLTGALGPQRLQALYGLTFDEPNILILMQHRAVLFGLLGGFLLWAAFRPALVTLALIAGFVSVLSFLGFALLAPSHNALIGRVVVADWAALACLVVAAALHLRGLR
ncbi:MAG TPA: phosphopantetheine adenylyltransferase [Polaromonas sp.]|uniref:phosphopantetheine adenylyltransferase n=1 Tax=Polaromonas sp. TaxID=1869339 RepID=UPI002D75947A|nr:phosphopantetheine adenylyltransferase [Polaromonas sp.]HYW57276.1 phosphopantetheine adenylyltransferase [Polaromonas sp.]